MSKANEFGINLRETFWCDSLDQRWVNFLTGGARVAEEPDGRSVLVTHLMEEKMTSMNEKKMRCNVFEDKQNVTTQCVFATQCLVLT